MNYITAIRMMKIAAEQAAQTAAQGQAGRPSDTELRANQQRLNNIENRKLDISKLPAVSDDQLAETDYMLNNVYGGGGSLVPPHYDDTDEHDIYLQKQLGKTKPGFGVRGNRSPYNNGY